MAGNWTNRTTTSQFHLNITHSIVVGLRTVFGCGWRNTSSSIQWCKAMQADQDTPDQGQADAGWFASNFNWFQTEIVSFSFILTTTKHLGRSAILQNIMHHQSFFHCLMTQSHVFSGWHAFLGLQPTICRTRTAVERSNMFFFSFRNKMLMINLLLTGFQIWLNGERMQEFMTGSHFWCNCGYEGKTLQSFYFILLKIYSFFFSVCQNDVFSSTSFINRNQFPSGKHLSIHIALPFMHRVLP